MKKILLTIAAIATCTLNAVAGADNFYAFKTQIEAYPTGKGRVYVDKQDPTNYTVKKEDRKYEEKVEVEQVETMGYLYCYAAPLKGWKLAGFQKGIIEEDESVFYLPNLEVTDEFPAYLSLESEITDDPGTVEDFQSDSLAVAALMPFTPNNYYRAVFTHITASIADGESSLGMTSVEPLSNDIDEDVTLTAEPADERCKFAYWTLNGEKVSESAEYKVKVKESADYVAHFTCDSAVVVDFGEEGGFKCWYDEANDYRIPSTVKSYSIYPDSLVMGKDAKINASIGSYYLSAANPQIIWGKGKVQFIKTPSEYPFVNESNLLRWSGNEGVKVSDLSQELKTSYYTFDAATTSFKLASNETEIAPNEVYMALPDTCYNKDGNTVAPAEIAFDITEAPKNVVAQDYVNENGEIIDGIERVAVIKSHNGKIYNLSGRRADATNREGIYIFDGKKVIYRKK